MVTVNEKYEALIAVLHDALEHFVSWKLVSYILEIGIVTEVFIKYA